MAGFRMHITVSGVCGMLYGGAAVQPLGFSADAAVLAAGWTGDEMCDDAAAVPVASLLGADARVSRVGAGAVDEDETPAAAGLALLARALRE